MAPVLMLDLDGVLVGGRPEDGARWTKDLQRDLGLCPDALSAGFFYAGWQDVVEGRAALLPVLQSYLDKVNSSVQAEGLVAYWFAKDARIDVDVLQDVRILRQKGLQVVLTTNQDHSRASYLMDKMGLAKEVDGLVYSAQAGAQKPDPQFYAHAEQVVGRSGTDLLLVDDTRANVDGALNAGWRGHVWMQGARLTHLLGI